MLMKRFNFPKIASDVLVYDFNRSYSKARYILLLLFGASIVHLASCTATSLSIQQRAASVASKGQELCAAANKSYSLIEKHHLVDVNQEWLQKVISHPNPASVKLSELKFVSPFNSQLKERKGLFDSLKRCYSVFYTLSDVAFADKAKDGVDAVSKAVEGLSKSKNSPLVAAALPEITTMVAQGIQAGEIKKHNKVLHSLCQSYKSLWEMDKVQWKDYLNQTYQSTANGLNNLAENHIEASRLKELIKEPFTQTINFQLYKLKKLAEADSLRNNILDNIENVNDGFDALEKLHAELAKNEPAISEITAILGKLDVVLKKIEKE